MTKHGFWLIIRFDEPVILSSSNATAGDHRTLDHVPGSALLGIAASRLYRTLDDDDLRYGIFHGSKASFGNAYPLDGNGQTSLPSPLSLHSPKVWSTAAGKQKPKINLAFPGAGDGLGQLEQIRGQFMTTSGGNAAPRGRLSLRTAIDSTSGTAAESQLFSYSHLPAGARFAAWIEAETAEIETLLAETMTGAARLGRSRSAEFGRCTLTVLPGKSLTVETQPTDGFAIVYCLADVALEDAYGFPVREPSAPLFGLTGGTIDWARTHLRSRRYSPFNAAIRTYETERLVLEKGSVMTFDCKGQTVLGGVTRIGMFQAAGLGLIAINPAFLLSEALGDLPGRALDMPMGTYETGDAVGTLPRSPSLAALLKLRTSGSTGAVEWADAFRPSLVTLYRTARALGGVAPGVPVGPSKAQWGRIDALASEVSDTKALLAALARNNVFGRTTMKDGKEERLPDDAWATLGEVHGEFRSFEHWFKTAMRGALPGTTEPDSKDKLKAFIRMGQSVAGQHNPGKNGTEGRR